MQSTCIRSYAECLQVHWSGYASQNRVWRFCEYPWRDRTSLVSILRRSSLLPTFDRKERWTGYDLGAGNITELCNCIITRVWIRGFVTFNRVERKKREREKKNDDYVYDKWSAFIMQRSTITTGMQMDRWKNQRDSLISISVCVLMSKHAWSYDSNEYKLYCKRIFVTGRGRKLYQSFHED